MNLLTAVSSVQTIFCLTLIKKSFRSRTSTQALNFDAVTHSGIYLPSCITLPSAYETASHNTLQALRNLQCTSAADLWRIIVYNQV